MQKRLHQGAHDFCILKQLWKIERLHETQQKALRYIVLACISFEHLLCKLSQ